MAALHGAASLEFPTGGRVWLTAGCGHGAAPGSAGRGEPFVRTCGFFAPDR